MKKLHYMNYDIVLFCSTVYFITTCIQSHEIEIILYIPQFHIPVISFLVTGRDFIVQFPFCQNKNKLNQQQEQRKKNSISVYSQT